MVEPAASLPYVATQFGARVVEINPIETPLSPFANHVLRGPSGVVLPDLLLAAFGRQLEGN
jgi:NAD-dependent deacetylase